ncbi:MAG: class I SAM-dependent methyltransferase [Planctomycetes bacterium]|nr:class I SAM-dependent methyltransferase [Planctomycetota bacterium]
MLKGAISRLRNRVVRAILGTTRTKEMCELGYWRGRARQEGQLRNDHYARFFTEHFGLDRGFYEGKRVLDIGCGPRGSLEWASMAAERVGLDPLADSYRALRTERHAMSYASSPAERMPFPDGRFDVVSSFNSLDHVEDLDRVISEIARVVKPGGLFLLLTDVNHDPMPCEPICYSWDIVSRFGPAFDLIEERRYEPHPKGIYDAILSGVRYDDANPAPRKGVLSALFRRRADARIREATASAARS